MTLWHSPKVVDESLGGLDNRHFAFGETVTGRVCAAYNTKHIVIGRFDGSFDPEQVAVMTMTDL